MERIRIIWRRCIALSASFNLGVYFVARQFNYHVTYIINKLFKYKLTHTELCLYMQKKGYQCSIKGVCKGVAYMGLQAILTNEIDTFNAILVAIKKDIGNDAAIDDEMAVNIVAFCDGLVSFQSPNDYTYLFEEDNIPSIGINPHLNVASIVNSNSIDKKNGLNLCDIFLGVYTQNELVTLFQELRKILIENRAPSIGLIISNSQHAIAVGFNAVNQRWIFVDANNFPAEYVKSEIMLVKKISNGLLGNTQISLSLYSTIEDKEYFEIIINRWKEKTCHIRKLGIKTDRWFHGNPNQRSLLDTVLQDENHLDTLEQLLNKKSLDVNHEAVMPLHLAVSFSSFKVVKTLLGHPAIRFDIPDIRGNFPLHLAVHRGDIKILKMLLEHPALDINKTDTEKFSPLHWAVYKGNIEIVKILLNYPYIDINTKDCFGNSPLDAAKNRGDVEIINMLQAHNNMKTEYRKKLIGRMKN